MQMSLGPAGLKSTKQIHIGNRRASRGRRRIKWPTGACDVDESFGAALFLQSYRSVTERRQNPAKDRRG